MTQGISFLFPLSKHHEKNENMQQQNVVERRDSHRLCSFRKESSPHVVLIFTSLVHQEIYYYVDSFKLNYWGDIG